MKITKEEIQQIIREEYKTVKENYAANQQESAAKAAKQLGYMLVGQPPTAKAVKDALADRFPDAAEALYSAYQEAQRDADMQYSDNSFDDDDDLYEEKKK